MQHVLKCGLWYSPQAIYGSRAWLKLCWIRKKKKPACLRGGDINNIALQRSILDLHSEHRKALWHKLNNRSLFFFSCDLSHLTDAYTWYYFVVLLSLF